MFCYHTSPTKYRSQINQQGLQCKLGIRGKTFGQTEEVIYFCKNMYDIYNLILLKPFNTHSDFEMGFDIWKIYLDENAEIFSDERYENGYFSTIPPVYHRMVDHIKLKELPDNS
jgi:hypothetical protein